MKKLSKLFLLGVFLIGGFVIFTFSKKNEFISKPNSTTNQNNAVLKDKIQIHKAELILGQNGELGESKDLVQSKDLEQNKYKEYLERIAYIDKKNDDNFIIQLSELNNQIINDKIITSKKFEDLQIKIAELRMNFQNENPSSKLVEFEIETSTSNNGQINRTLKPIYSF